MFTEFHAFPIKCMVLSVSAGIAVLFSVGAGMTWSPIAVPSYTRLHMYTRPFGSM
jgi:hypothetical protein